MSSIESKSALDRSAIDEGQLAKLKKLLASLTSNRFYLPILKQAGVDESIASLGDFFTRMPLTTKEQVTRDQLCNPPYGTNLTHPLEHYTRFWQTSGSTAKPMRWLDDEAGWSWMLDGWDAIYDACGVEPGDRLFFAFSFGPFLGFWTAYAAAARRGCLCIPGGGMTTAGRLQCITENAITVLFCTPTYAIRLGESAPQHYINLKRKSKVRMLIVAGEPGGSIPSTRQAIEQLWPRATVFDHHGMTEVGPISWQQPNAPGNLVVNEAEFIAEIIDPHTGEKLPPGQRGELVLTNLGRPASPLLRYRTGDLALADESPDPDTGYLVLRGGILGRADDMIHIRGVNVYPSAVEQVIRSYPGVGEFRATITVQRGMDEMTIQLEPAADCKDPQQLARDIADGLRTCLTLRIPVEIVEKGSLPRFDFKSRRWVRVEG